MIKKYNYYFLSLLILLLSYYLLSHKIDNEMILPRLNLIFNYFKNLSFRDLLENISYTFIKAITSYLISLVLAFALAIISFYRKSYRIIRPLMSILKSLPTISIILISLIWLGKEKSIYIIAILVILPILYEMFYFQIKNVNQELLEVCIVYQFNWLKKIKYLYCFQILEGFMLTLKQTFGLCFKIIVMAEVIGQAKYGIGAKIQNEKINLEIAGVFSWTIILVLLVLVIDYLINHSSKYIIKWK